uniref:Uncharacterized protein n=1 Tax=Pyrodinium bahamense TaxID=73915 RepID=A0A7S0FR08_9DINO
MVAPLPRLRVDGARCPHALAPQLAAAASTFGAELHTVGQAGLLGALLALGQLGRGSSDGSTWAGMPAFSIAHAEAGAEGSGDGRGREYCIRLGDASTWVRSALTEQVVSWLFVRTATPARGLAKALAARVADVPQGRAVGLEAPLLGPERPRKLRVAKLAHAVATAHAWQVTPSIVTLPTRPFQCTAVLTKPDDPAAEGLREGHWEGWFLQVCAWPKGPCMRQRPSDV